MTEFEWKSQDNHEIIHNSNIKKNLRNNLENPPGYIEQYSLHNLK